MTKVYKYLWLLSGVAGLVAAFSYFQTKENIAIVLVAFIACIVFRMLYVKSTAE